MFVYAKFLDAPSTLLGFIAALAPLMTIFQLPAAQRLGRYGYRRFVMMGWSLRAALILIIAMTPSMRFLDNRLKLVGLLILLLGLKYVAGHFFRRLDAMDGPLDSRGAQRALYFGRSVLHVHWKPYISARECISDFRRR
jgi:predicted membrane channel-forming protein YqfA (hemolysin III family)